MEKRKYTRIQVLEAEIVSMHEAGKTHREIAEHFTSKHIVVGTQQPDTALYFIFTKVTYQKILTLKSNYD
ncbi:hypothetical protein N510_003200 [Firmicutes bacterium ASF500]|nr:hypothetical protein N510_003200 [Firmicutes bacterium ASF500]